MLDNLGCLTGPEPVPMHARRPQWLAGSIDQRFEALQQAGPKGYSFNGESLDYFFDGPDRSAMQLVEYLEGRHARQLRILDIGAAAGGFVLACLERGHQAQGLSAHNYRDFTRFNMLTNKLAVSAYVVGDANKLAAIPGMEDEYDLIVSQNTFVHLMDTVGVLEQAANKVSPGGIIAIKAVDIGGSIFYHQRQMSGVTAELVAAGLTRGGFRVLQTPRFPNEPINTISTLFAERKLETSEVRFEVGYSGSAEGWQYTVSS